LPCRRIPEIGTEPSRSRRKWVDFRVFARVVVWAHTRRRIVFIGTAALLVVSLFGLQRLTFDADVLRLLPSGGETIPAFRTYLERFGTLDDFYIVLTAPEGHAISEYRETIDAWIERLRQEPRLRRIDAGQLDNSQDWRWLGNYQLLLMDEPTLERALARFEPQGLRDTLRQTRNLLAVPAAGMSALLQEDPLRLTELLQEQMRLQSPASLRASADGYLTADQRRRLIVAQPAEPPFNTTFARQLMERLTTLSAELTARPPLEDDTLPPLQVELAGGHRIAVEAEAVVRRESVINAVGSLALILPFLYLVFRSLRLVLIGALPSAVALLVVLGVLGTIGVTLSAAAAGASAMLFGLGIDGVVLLYVAHRHAQSRATTAVDAVRSLEAPAASMLLGMWTTAATFLGLVVVDFPSLEQLGLLIGISMLVCGAMTLFLVPASLPGTGAGQANLGASSVRQLMMPAFAAGVQQHRRVVLGLAMVTSLIAGVTVTRLKFDPTLEGLRATTEGAAVLERISRDFALPQDVAVIMRSGAQLSQLLEADERLVARLRQGPPSITVQSAASLIPAPGTAERRQARIQSALPPIDTIRSSIETIGADLDFRPESFVAFYDRLPKLLSPDSTLTWESLQTHGFSDLTHRFVVREDDGWLVATYAFPTDEAGWRAVRQVVAAAGESAQLTGMPLVNAELGDRFVPEFLRGLSVGSVVVVLLIWATFRSVSLAALTLIPTVIGLTWAAALLTAAGYTFDLFAVFAVMTFIGIGVDYGIHLVHRYRERGDSVRATAELAPVILVAGGITLLGYGTLIGSSYAPLRSIGVVSSVSIVCLVVSSVFILPALLAYTERNRE